MGDSPAHDEPGPSWDDASLVPLFPLPNVVLFPRAVLPLHIFEERYKAMTAHALEGDRRVALALLRPGWEKSYYGRPAIEPVVCVGRILTHEKLPDGKYNFLLQGQTRARILFEAPHDPYRVARLEPLVETALDEEELAAEREALVEIFRDDAFAHTAMGRQFSQLLSTPLPTPALADLIVFSFLDDVCLKQSLLAETDVRRRVDRTLEALQSVRPVLQSLSVRTFKNPGVN